MSRLPIDNPLLDVDGEFDPVNLINPYAYAAAPAGASYSDNFNRANENPIGGDWANAHASHQISSNSLFSNYGATIRSISLVKSSVVAFAGDHWAEVVVGAGYPPGNGIAVRVQGDADARCYYTPGESGNGKFAFEKMTNSGGTASTFLGWSSNTTISAGDVLRLQATGTSTVTIELFKNGVSLGTVTDSSSPHSGGQPGIASGGGSTCDDFSAEDV